MGLNWNEIKSRALLFSKTWADACNENSQAKPFWIDFFEIFGITNKRVATFELNVKKLNGAQGFVDLFWPGVLLVEHKSLGKDLDKALGQAVGYLHHLKEYELPQLVVVCDFARFRVRILATGETVKFELQHLHKHVKLFGLLAGYKVQDIRAEDPVNIKAAERMGRLHDALKASGYSGHALEVLLVRLLFCLFADDTGIFQPAQAFRDWVEERTAPDGSDLGPRLGQLFQVLNTPEQQRNKNIDEQLGQFAYVNGRLFEETLPMADFSTAMREALLDACALDWSAISPAIFGSLFQSIMDDKARRNLGAHYTSEANILKLIKPLFLDELHAEFESVKGNRNKLLEFHKKLRQLTFLDPACGCGNFLVIIRNIKLGIAKLRPPLDLESWHVSFFFADAYCLDIKWSESNGIKSFQALEMKTEKIRINIGGQHYFPARYLHAEFDLGANCFTHFDGAIQLLTEDEYFQRRDSDFNMTMKNLTHIKARSSKVFKINGPLKTADWVEFCCHFYAANPLTFKYFSGEYPQYITEALQKIRVNDRNSTNKPNNLRDHMTDLELIFTMLGEASTTEIARRSDAQGFVENRTSAKDGGKLPATPAKR